MPDWKDLDFDSIADREAEETDNELASKISSLTRMTDEEVKELFPKYSDAEKLKRLMEIVKSADERNTKINNIVANIEELGGTVLTLVSKFI
ncbi:MAG: hypothetical protein ABFS12_11010 [Bacteroidota bacterium]